MEAWPELLQRRKFTWPSLLLGFLRMNCIQSKATGVSDTTIRKTNDAKYIAVVKFDQGRRAYYKFKTANISFWTHFRTENALLTLIGSSQTIIHANGHETTKTKSINSTKLPNVCSTWIRRWESSAICACSVRLTENGEGTSHQTPTDLPRRFVPAVIDWIELTCLARDFFDYSRAPSQVFGAVLFTVLLLMLVRQSALISPWIQIKSRGLEASRPWCVCHSTTAPMGSTSVSLASHSIQAPLTVQERGMWSANIKMGTNEEPRNTPHLLCHARPRQHCVAVCAGIFPAETSDKEFCLKNHSPGGKLSTLRVRQNPCPSEFLCGASRSTWQLARRASNWARDMRNVHI